MTGNNKVWRAPVAGLASVAMLATLGVSAMTANAADQEATVTIHGNGLQLENGSGAKDDVTVTYQYGAISQANALKNIIDNLDDGVATAANPELSVPANVTVPTVNHQYLLFKSASYGVEDDAFQAGADVATDLYVHYGNEDATSTVADETVTMSGSISDYDTNSLPTILVNKDGKLDRIADWQVPTDKNYGDGELVKSFTANGTEVDLTGDLTPQVNANTNELVIGASMYDAAELAKITFSGSSLTDDQSGYYLLEAQPNNSYVATDCKFDVVKGEAFSKRYKAPSVKLNASQANMLSVTWATRKEDSKNVGKYVADQAFDPAAVVNSDLTLYVNKASKVFNVYFQDANGNVANTVQVVEGEKVAKPADPTKAEDDTNLIRYTFDKWLDATNNEYDFDQPVKSDLTLKPTFTVSEMGVSFDPAHDNAKPIIKWFKNGDKFELPENPTRDNYTFLRWETDPPASTNARKYVGATLRIDTSRTTPVLRYLTAGGPTGNATGQNVIWSKVSTSFKAVWDSSQPEKTLANLEAVTPDKFLRGGSTTNDYLSGDEQSVFTADSFDQYVSDYQDYLAAKDAAKTSGNVITNEEAADLYAQLSEAQSKLVFKAEKTMQRWQKNDQHIYTDSSAEQKALKLAGWKHEALADFNTVDVDATKAAIVAVDSNMDADAIVNGLLTKVSRLYEYATGNYMLTADENEVKVLTSEAKTWKNETFSAVYTPKNGTVEADRFYVNYNGEHLIITDPEESAALKADTTNFHYDGVKFWVY